MIPRYEAAFLDLDGTVYRGEQLIPDVDNGIEILRNANVKILFVSNKATERRENYVEKLQNLGIETARDQVINSGWVTAKYVAEQYPESQAFIIGEDPLISEFHEAGITTTTESEADLVVASMDRSFTYEKLERAMKIIEQGGAFLATNPDRTCPTEDGAIPDAAGMIGAVEGVTGRNIDAVLGKPSGTMVRTALETVNAEPSECLIIGDRLETDILMGNQAGMTTVLVLSGVTDRETLNDSAVEPDHIIETLADIGEVIEF